MVNYETQWNHHFSGSEPSLEAGLRPNSAKLEIIPGILRVYLGKPGYTWQIPGILPISPIFVRFCLRSRGKSYHRLIVLAVECLIVLVGYTSKWQASGGARGP